MFSVFCLKNKQRQQGPILVQITVHKGDVTFRLVASGYRDKPDKIS